MDAENIGNDGCSQRDSAEHKGYVRAHRSFNRIWKERDSAQPDLLEKILDRDNLNRAFKRVKANKGAPGVDGMTIDETQQWLKEHNRELMGRTGSCVGSTRRNRSDGWRSRSRTEENGNSTFLPSQTVSSSKPWCSR